MTHTAAAHTTTSNTAPTNTHLRDTVVRIEEEVGHIYRDRDDVIHGLILAMLTKQHLFMLGLPGTGKSEMTRELTSRISGQIFDHLMMRGTLPEELFGPYSVPEIRRGKFQRVTTGKLPEADVAFLDEVWKGGSGVLNSLLGLMDNSRRFDGKRCPLQFVVGASNELPEDESLQALYARFCLRYEVRPLEDWDDVSAVLWGENGDAQPTSIDVGALEEARREIAEVSVGEKAREALKGMLSELAQQECRPDLRRLHWAVGGAKAGVPSLSLAKAEAWLNGRAEVTPIDLRILQHVVWEEPKDQRRVRKIVFKHAAPKLEAMTQYFDELCEQFGLIAGQERPDQQMVKDTVARAHAWMKDSQEAIDCGEGTNEIRSMMKQMAGIIARHEPKGGK